MNLKNQLLGIWYNDMYLLEIQTDRVVLRTNIDTKHKPFYTKEIINELLLWEGSDKKIKIAKDIHLIEPTNSNVIVVALQTYQQGLQMLRLIRFD